MAEILTSYSRSLGPQKGLLFEDSSLQIGFTTECKGNKIMIKLFMGNKTQSDMTLETFQIGRASGLQLKTEPEQVAGM